MKRKTVDIKEMVEFANMQLSRPECSVVTREFKEGVACMCEKMLVLTGNYNGFSFNNPKDKDCDIGTFGFYSRHYHLK